MPRAIVVVGPTASGKTEIALDKARRLNGEIINCDSLQVYSDLKILTSFPKKEYFQEINHKLFGYLGYSEKTSAVEWAKLASSEIKNTLDSGKIPIVTGGTGLYVQILMNGISLLPEISPQNRRIANELATHDFKSMRDELYSLDPELKHLLSKEKHHQIIRAYEIFLETGKSVRFFHEQPKQKFIESVTFEVNMISIERDILYKNIEKRFDEMLEQGAVDEVKNLLIKIGDEDHEKIFEKFPIFKAIGAKEITQYLDGHLSFDKMRELTIKNTRHYAKRQITWFRHQVQL